MQEINILHFKITYSLLSLLYGPAYLLKAKYAFKTEAQIKGREWGAIAIYIF